MSRFSRAKKAALKAKPVKRVADYIKAEREKEQADTYIMQAGGAESRPRKVAKTSNVKREPVLGAYCDNMKRGTYNRPMPLPPEHLDRDNPKRIMMEGSTSLSSVNLDTVSSLYGGAVIQKIVHTPKQAELRRPFKAIGVFGTNAQSEKLGKFLSSVGNSEKVIKEQAVWAEPMKVAKSTGKKYQSILSNNKLTERQKSIKLREMVERNNVSDKKGAKVRTSPAAGQKVFEGLMAQEGVTLERDRPILYRVNK